MPNSEGSLELMHKSSVYVIIFLILALASIKLRISFNNSTLTLSE